MSNWKCRSRLVVLGTASLAVAAETSADSVGRFSYDAMTDSIVVTMLYSGTNPDHRFSLKWDPCRTHSDGTHDAAGEVLDDQARDPARQDFKKTVHLSLEGLSCRPAKITLRVPPRSYFSLRIPAFP